MVDNKFAVMKFVARHKLLFGCLLVAWIIGMIFTVVLISRSGNTKIKVQRTSHPLIHPWQHNRLPPASSFKMYKALKYCNPPNDIIIGQEGKIIPNVTLEFVALVIRHGDRAPLRPIRNQSIINCGVTEGSPLLMRYLRTLKHLRGSAKHLFPFATFPLHPAERQCTLSQMTLVGAYQHLMLGHVLKKSYIDDHSLLDKNWTSENIKLYSTVYSRTFQSAVAFLFGFLPIFNISNIKITASADTRFCMTDYYCKCPLLEHLQSLVDKKTRRLLVSHPAVVQLLQRLNPIVKFHPNHSDITNPVAMFDSLMGYVCHGSPLPCIPGRDECVTFEQVRNVIAFLDWEGRQFVKDGTHKRMSLLKMYGFLVHLLNHIKNYTNKKSSTRFVLYSGHDVTVEPLLAALALDDGSIPPYASRIAFEVYSLVMDNHTKYILKIIYNGKDVTKYAVFCKRYVTLINSNIRVCPIESFFKFVEEDFFAAMKSSSYDIACDISHATSDPNVAKHSSYVDESDKS